jgi:hypothetical protein
MATRAQIKLTERIEAVVGTTGRRKTVYVWRENGEADTATVARHLSINPSDRGTRYVCVGWAQRGARLSAAERPT